MTAPGRPPAGALAVALALALAAAAAAQPSPPPAPVSPFTDHAGVVSAEDAARIEARLREIEKTSHQIVAVIYPETPPGYAGVEEFANRTAQAWKVGDDEKDDGVALFVFLAERKVRIEVGYGLEGALPDALAARIIRDEIGPAFRRNQYAAGVMAAVEAIDRATRGEYAPREKDGEEDGSGLERLIFIIVVIIVLYSWFGPRGHYRTYSRGGWRGGDLYTGGWSSAGRGWGGPSGGGFGGGWSGGGGSFGGGGASGSW